MHQCQSIIMVLCSQTWHGGPYTSRQCLDMTQAISWWLSADLQVHVSVYGRRKLTVTEVLNLWVRRSRELKEAWKKIDWLEVITDREAPHRMIGSTWAFGPADTPWYKKAVESLTKEAKCSIHFSVSNQGLSVHEFLTVCNEVSNLMNEPPIGVKPSEDSIINVLTPNSLLLGWATASMPPGMATIWHKHFLLVSPCPVSGEGLLETMDGTVCANSVATAQMAHCKMQLAPWRCSNQADKNMLWGDYCLALVKEVFPGEDRKVRRVAIQYIKSYRSGERAHEYRGARDTVVSRAVQRLALLVSAEWSL